MKSMINIYGTKMISILLLSILSFYQPVYAKSPAKEITSADLSFLSTVAPVTPREATFEDLIPEKAPSMVNAAPVTPNEAGFDDEESSVEVSDSLLKKVAPRTPAESDFKDDTIITNASIRFLEFTAPAEATFSDQ
jgi:hypothetical protein